MPRPRPLISLGQVSVSSGRRRRMFSARGLPGGRSCPRSRGCCFRWRSWSGHAEGGERQRPKSTEVGRRARRLQRDRAYAQIVAAHNVADLDRRLGQIDSVIEEAAKRGKTNTALSAIEAQRQARAGSPVSETRRPDQDDRRGHRCETLHLLRPSIASSSSSSARGEIPSERNPGSLSEAVVSICISST